MSSMLFVLLAARSIWASMPTMVALAGIVKPKPVTSRFALWPLAAMAEDASLLLLE